MPKALTQKQRILRLLLAGRVLTRVNVKFAARLASRINELIKDGWVIQYGWQKYKDTRIRTYKVTKAELYKHWERMKIKAKGN